MILIEHVHFCRYIEPVCFRKKLNMCIFEEGGPAGFDDFEVNQLS